MDGMNEEERAMLAMARACAGAAKESALAFHKLGIAANQVPMLPPSLIAKLRLASMREEFGWFRFFLVDWWQWKWMAR